MFLNIVITHTATGFRQHFHSERTLCYEEGVSAMISEFWRRLKVAEGVGPFKVATGRLFVEYRANLDKM